MLNNITVADLFVQCLVNEGVTHIFGLPGEENEEFLFSLAKSNIKFITTRHEQGAAFMANVWGRLTGKAGVCMATLGPGATNLITGVADAHLDKAPLVAITAQGGLNRLHHESHQTIDIIKMFNAITKWNGTIYNAEVVSEITRKAFKLAEREKPGATHIELSEDVATQIVTGDSLPIERVAVLRSGPNRQSLRKAAQLIRQAKRPIILAGNGAIRTRCSNLLSDVAQKFNIPVVSTFMGKGAISDKLEQSLFTVGLGFYDYPLHAICISDLVISIGYDIAEYSPEKWNSCNCKNIIHIDFEPAEIYKHYIPTVEINGDIADTINELFFNTEKGSLQVFDSNWYATIRDSSEDFNQMFLDENPGLNAATVINSIRTCLPDDGLLISDVGSHKLWIARNFRTYNPNSCIISNGFSSMGIALPGAIAASMVYPKRPIVAVMGDGGFLMNGQELETAKRLNVSFTAVILNDNDFGLISWKQLHSKGNSLYTKIGNPNIETYAASFGIQGHRINSIEDLDFMLRQSVKREGITLLEVPIDASINLKLQEKLKHTFLEIKYECNKDA